MDGRQFVDSSIGRFDGFTLAPAHALVAVVTVRRV
jgi:hypothetical protein